MESLCHPYKPGSFSGINSTDLEAFCHGLVYKNDFHRRFAQIFYLVRLVRPATQNVRIKQTRFWIVTAAFGYSFNMKRILDCPMCID
jgi:hypothetical protein